MARGLPNERLIVERLLATHDLAYQRPRLSSDPMDSGAPTVLGFPPKHKGRQLIARFLVLLLAFPCPIRGRCKSPAQRATAKVFPRVPVLRVPPDAEVAHMLRQRLLHIGPRSRPPFKEEGRVQIRNPRVHFQWPIVPKLLQFLLLIGTRQNPSMTVLTRTRSTSKKRYLVGL